MNIIRKIIVGTNPKDAMAYFLGMRAGDGKISAILLDDKYMNQFSRSRFLIYIENSEGTILWKSIESMPCVVEYDCKFN